MGQVVIPYAPRPMFMPLHESPWRFAAVVTHRRFGKTVGSINHLLRGALTCNRKDPRFAYVAPTFTQAKDVAWEYLKFYASPLFDHGATANESELRVDLPNSGRVRLYGAENFDRLRGLYLDGVVLDEYATMDPRIWEVVRPALSDRAGWCIWIGTPKGHNAFYDVWKKANDNDGGNWFAMRLRASETGVLPTEELTQARRDLTPEQFEQEYECSFEAAVVGSYYGKEMEVCEREGRISNVGYEGGSLVHTAWDLGIGDSTAIIFTQRIGQEWRFIDYVEGSGVGLDWYVHELQKRGYNYGQHVFPHDVVVKELTTGKSRQEVLERLGIKVTIAPKLMVDDGIQQVRLMLRNAWFDKTKCARLVEALKLYRRAFDEKAKAFRSIPMHDWTSHPADAMRYCAVGVTGFNAVWSGGYDKFSQGVQVI